MKPTAKLAFSAVMFGAAVFWAAGRVAVAQRTDALEPNVSASEPSGLVQITDPRDTTDSGVPEVESSRQSTQTRMMLWCVRDCIYREETRFFC